MDHRITQPTLRLLVGAVAALTVLSLGAAPSDARPARGDAVTISMQALTLDQPSFAVLIPNFERVYPNITINATYAASNTQLDQLETTELVAGNAPDLLTTVPGCGQLVSMCDLAKAGDLAPMVNAPWVKRSLPLVTSLAKYGQGLFTFEPVVSPAGLFSNDTLFEHLGLQIPQTFSQLLDVCHKAQAAGTVAMLFAGANTAVSTNMIVDLAVATVYAKNKQWTGELKAGKVSFDGTPGWHQALQELIDMNNAGCFQAGAAGASTASAMAQFAQGQGLMYSGLSGSKGTIDAASPQFAYSFHPLPGGTAPNQTTTFVNLASSLSVNAHSSAQDQAAAQSFVDFIARPKQDALYAQLKGSLTQYEFLKGQIPEFMAPFATVFKQREYVINPTETWWNANVLLALQQDGIGVITGQLSIDDVLNAMDAAWRQGPS